MDILCSLVFIHYIILHSNLKTYYFSFFSVVLIWCRSGELVAGQVDFYSPPDNLS